MTTPERAPLAGLAYTGVGFSFAAIVGGMALLGHLADGWLGTEPWPSILSSTTRADGFVIIPQDSEGFPEGTEVDVYLYDPWNTGI